MQRGYAQPNPNPLPPLTPTPNQVCSLLEATRLLLRGARPGAQQRIVDTVGSRRGNTQPCAVRNLTELPLLFTTSATTEPDQASLVGPGETLTFESRVQGEAEGEAVDRGVAETGNRLTLP